MSVDRIRAPYGFVPLSATVACPEWASAASQDLPFEDGIDGVFTLRVEAQSPLHVRGTTLGVHRSFRTPDERFAIPGSTLRGMLRNVVEIASFGKMSRVSDRRYALRDLHNHRAYVQHMARIVSVRGKSTPIPIVNAGWLVPTGDDAQPAVIHPCHFAKIEYALLTQLAETEHRVGGFQPGRKQSSVDKYEAFERATGRSVAETRWPVSLRIDAIPRQVPQVRMVSDFGKVSGKGETPCALVFTGQPSEHVPGRVKARGAGSPKHHDFVFYGRGKAGPEIPVSARQFEDFEFVHSATGQQHRKSGELEPNVEWKFWKERVWNTWRGDRKPTVGVPVFFLLKSDGSLRALGLAMMFRLPGLTSVREGILRRQPRVEGLDLAETLFGTVPDRRRGDPEDAEALAGRLSIGLARAVGTPTEQPEVKVVLGSPKASYYPSYLEQDPARGVGAPPPRDNGKPVYKTWNDSDAVPRGWKRYRPIERQQVIKPPPPRRGDGSAIADSKMETRFVPLAPGTRFEAEVRLHNARPVELGALLWALDLGGLAEGAHKLGLGRSLGYGTVRLTAQGVERLRRNDGAPVDAVRCIEAYRAWMEAQCRDVPGGWAASAQIKELQALALPMPAEDARHMQISHPADGNEFQQAKLAGLVLRPAAEHTNATRSPERAHLPSRSTERSAQPSGNGLPAVGERVRVRLVEKSKKGKWQAELLDGRGRGTFVQGEPPPGVDAGTEVEARVVRAPGRTTIEFAW